MFDLENIDYQTEADNRTAIINALNAQIPTIETEYLELLLKLILYETELRDAMRNNHVTEALLVKPSLAMRELMIAINGNNAIGN